MKFLLLWLRVSPHSRQCLDVPLSGVILGSEDEGKSSVTLLGSEVLGDPGVSRNVRLEVGRREVDKVVYDYYTGSVVPYRELLVLWLGVYDYFYSYKVNLNNYIYLVLEYKNQKTLSEWTSIDIRKVISVNNSHIVIDLKLEISIHLVLFEGLVLFRQSTRQKVDSKRNSYTLRDLQKRDNGRWDDPSNGVRRLN